MGLIGKYVGKRVGEATASKAKSASGKTAGNLYGKAVGKATEKTIVFASKKVLTRIDESNNEHLAIGSQKELLSRNPQNEKLILFPQESTLRILDRDEHQKYRIESAIFAHRTWYLYGKKIRKLASVTEKRNAIKRILHRKAKPRLFIIKVGKEVIGTLNTIYNSDNRIGTTDFNDWRIEDETIYDGDQVVASYQKARSWMEVKHVLDFVKGEDEIVILLVLFAMRKADEPK